ncbi:MAG: carboxypeptidase-like regulatory domain-containing protein, partial [Bacteroidota bacterium]|nr:carboxypeptidase-like regulatory domain-containing protein [Bacteroidota bacterium]
SIIGATVIIKTINPIKGVVTDYDGNFTLENIPAGKHNITIKYISFQEKIIEGLDVQKGKVLEINVLLSKSDQEIERVIISANAVKNSDIAMLTKQKKSMTILNGLSAQSIANMGDSDAASALKRVTGISVESGKYVFVRGLSDRYSKITLNGAEIPGLDPNKNTVQMDLFSSNIIQNIIVQKTFSPDLPASFAGGYVNIVTKSFPNKFTMQMSASAAYNEQSNLNPNFLLYKGGTTDWFATDDGLRSIPSNIGNDVPFLYENNDKLDDISSSFNKIMEPIKMNSFINQSYSFSVGNIIKIRNKDLGFIMDFSYSSKYKYYDNGVYARYNLVTDNLSNNGIMNPLVNEKEIYGEQEVLTSALIGISYKFNPFNKISFNIMRNGGGVSSARVREGSKPEDNLFMFENTLAYQQRSFVSAQINGSHILGDNKNQIQWNSSYTKSRLYEPDLRFFNYDSTSNGNYQISYSAYPAPSRFYRDLNEINIDNKIHVSLPFDNFKLKFGASFTYKSRTSQSRKFDILSQGLQFNGNISDYLSEENIGQNADVTYGVYYQNDLLTDKYNSYMANEYLFASYIMTEFKLSDKFDIQTGFRYEYDYTFIQNMVETYHPKYVNAEKIYPLDFLPALNLNYHMNKSVNFRFAASRTLGRPAFREIA